MVTGLDPRRKYFVWYLSKESLSKFYLFKNQSEYDKTWRVLSVYISCCYFLWVKE